MHNQEVVDITERNWLAAHVRGDKTAFAKLLSAYQRPVYSYLTRWGLDATTRDDVFQEIFLKVHRSAQQYEASRPLHPWIFTIVVNTVRNHARNAARRPAGTDGIAPDELPAYGAPDRNAGTEQTAKRVEAAIQQLPEAHREALLLCSVQGYSLAEVADLLGRPVNTVKTHLRRARQALLAILPEEAASS